MTTITIFGTLAVFVFPLVGHALGLDVLAAGLWAGTAVPDTAQTIAASAGYSTVGRDVATVVKLVRNVLMAPLLLLIAWAWSRVRRRRRGGHAGRSTQRRCGCFRTSCSASSRWRWSRTLRLVDPETVADVDVVTRACFVIALAGLGMQTRLGDLSAVGPRPVLLGFGTATLLAGATLIAILALGLGPARTEVLGAHDPRPQGAWTTVCKRGAPPAFAGAFVGLSRQPPASMGTPLGCARLDQATGDTIQRTTRGVATLRRATGQATFSDGRRSWAIAGTRLLSVGRRDHRAARRRAGQGAAAPAPAGPADPPIRTLQLTGRTLVRGIPGAGALSPVGTFHPGGPIHDKRSFAAATRRGEVLDPARLLVASTSNFGAPGRARRLGARHDPLARHRRARAR